MKRCDFALIDILVSVLLVLMNELLIGQWRESTSQSSHTIFTTQRSIVLLDYKTIIISLIAEQSSFNGTSH